MAAAPLTTAIHDAVRLCARLAQVRRGERDLASALAEYQADLLERGNVAVEFGGGSAADGPQR